MLTTFGVGPAESGARSSTQVSDTSGTSNLLSRYHCFPRNIPEESWNHKQNRDSKPAKAADPAQLPGSQSLGPPRGPMASLQPLQQGPSEVILSAEKFPDALRLSI